MTIKKAFKVNDLVTIGYHGKKVYRIAERRAPEKTLSGRPTYRLSADAVAYNAASRVQDAFRWFTASELRHAKSGFEDE